MKKNKLKKALALFLSMMMAMSALTACGNSDAGAAEETTDSAKEDGADAAETTEAAGEETEAAEAKDDGKRTAVHVAIADDLEDLAPWGGVTKPARYIVYGNIYQHLMQAERMGSSEMVGVLAKEWTQDDEFTYTITLYDYIKDTAGNEFKASDAVFSLESWAATTTNYIDHCEVISDYVFKVVLNTSAPGTFQRTMESAWMVTEAAYNASENGMATDPVGTNPYKVTEFVSDSKIVCEKVEDHWQEEDLIMASYKPNVDVVEYDIISEATQMGMALQSGTVQVGSEMDVSQVDQLMSNDALALTQGLCQSTRPLMFCMTPESPFYDNLALRQAVCYAIDKEALAELVGLGYGWAPKTMDSYESQVGYNPEWENTPYYQYDPEKAKELLAEAGYEPGQLNLRIMSNGNGQVKSMMEIVQADLMEVGINAEIIVADSSTFGANRDGTSGVYDITYAGQDYGNNVLTLWNNLYDASIRNSGWTWAGLDDPHLQEMLQTLNTAEGFTQENIDEFYHYTADNCLYHNLFMSPELYVHDARISNVPMDCMGFLRINAATYGEDYDVYAE